jgi:hypothetical protein
VNFKYSTLKSLFILSIVSLLIGLADRSPHHIEKRLGTNHLTNDFHLLYDGVIDKSIEGPYIYRQLVPQTVYFIEKKLNVNPIEVSFVFNVIVIYFTLLFFYLFSIQFIKKKHYSILSIFIPIFYILHTQTLITGVNIIELQDILNVLVMISGMYFIYTKKLWITGLIIIAGIFNRETPLFLLIPLCFMLYKQKVNFIPVLAISLVSIFTYFAIRFLIVGVNSSSPIAMIDKMSMNIPFINMDNIKMVVKSNIYLYLYLAPVFSFISVKNISNFEKGIYLMVILFIITHYFVGTIIEVRLFIPIVIIVTPFAIKNMILKLKI